ncbi:MAG: DUF2961 domain-containing protein [Prevotellaceae bacterium]|jgi:hypothetical protein|nr:DUF2961 domain-containing protein [Prevotellaceae bacterium]
MKTFFYFKRCRLGCFIVATFSTVLVFAQQPYAYDGLNNNLGNLYRLSNAVTRSISPENFSGERGKGGMADLKDKDKRNVANAWHAARDLGEGWKVNPYIHVEPEQTFTIAEIEGSGAIQHIWITPANDWRFTRLAIMRIYWDDEKEPSVACPLGDFFCMGWGVYAPLSSLAVCVNPARGFNCYWTMPFRKKCKITIENLADKDAVTLYYQVSYTLTEVPADAAYFHAQWRRSNPNTTSDYTIVDNIKGKGHYVGLYLAWGVNNNGWWGEGEIKFFMDGDAQFPTICGTGTEDYFCGSHNFDHNGQYNEFCTPYSGLHQVIRPDGTYRAQQRFGLYRWHIADPIRFEKNLKVTIQDLGWRYGGRYLPQQSDIASVVFWYQTEPHNPFPKLPTWEALEVN